MHILVVEPHPDDAFLSLGTHIEKIWKSQGHKITILTVYANEARYKEAQTYAWTVGSESIGMGLVESPMDSKPERIIPVPGLRDLVTQLGADLNLFPIGLQHPDHLRVASSRLPGCLRYLDTPYAAKQKLQEEVNSKTEGMSIYSIRFPSKLKWKRASIFKSQGAFFHFNPVEDYHYPEMVLATSIT